MSLSTLTGERDIIARLRAQIPNVTFRRGTYLDDSTEIESNEDGIFEPYVLVAFGGSYEYPRDNGLGGPRWDTQRATFTMYMVAPYDEVAQQVKDRVREALVGFMPTDAGPLTVNTGYAFMDADLGYNRYVQALGFSYLFNLSNVLQ